MKTFFGDENQFRNEEFQVKVEACTAGIILYSTQGFKQGISDVPPSTPPHPTPFFCVCFLCLLMETLHAALVSFTLCPRTLPRPHSGYVGFRCMTRSGSDYQKGLHGTAVRSTKRISVSLRLSFVSCAQSSYHPELFFFSFSFFLFLGKRAFSKRAQTGLLECCWIRLTTSCLQRGTGGDALS